MPPKPALLGGKPVRPKPFPSWPVFGVPEEARLLRALRSGKWGRLDGGEVERFEERFAAMHGCAHGIAVANGTVSLRVILLALGISAEDEVIVPPYTFISTASAVIEANAIPVFADVDIETFNLDPAAVAAAITPRTRAIIPVHFAGQPAPMDEILGLARSRGLFVIEDAAHAHGASYKGRPAGSLAAAASFSFQSSKNLTAGEGGLITTNDPALAEACRSIQNCGRVPDGLWYEHHVISGNYRLGELQGALLNAQLDRLEKQAQTREQNGKYLASRIEELPGIYPQRRGLDCTRHAYHLFMLRIDPAEFGVSRETAARALQAEGIPCSCSYGFPLCHQPLFRGKAFGPYLPKARARLDYTRVRCPSTELLCREQALWIEHRCLLGPRRNAEDIAAAFEKIHENRHALSECARKEAA